MCTKEHKLENNAINFCKSRRFDNNVPLFICEFDEKFCNKKDKLVIYIPKKKIIEQR
jgi:hypothetical protein